VRQKTKRRQRPTRFGRLKAINLPDVEVLDDIKEATPYKSKRIAEKMDLSYKQDAELVPARISEIHSNYNYIVEADGVFYEATLSGRLRQFLYESLGVAAVGDRVMVDISAEPDYRIEQVLPRSNTLSRYTSGSFQKEILIAANIDQVIITSSWRKPNIKAGLIDRYICIATLQEIEPVIVINKIDLCRNRDDYEELCGFYREMGYKLIATSTVTGEGMDELKAVLKDKDSVFSGQSGTGKSSLINFLQPGLDLETAQVSKYNEKGRHTTTRATLIPWDFGGHLLDTPGIKTINLHAADKDRIPRVFPGFANFIDGCHFRDCSHSHEEHCGVLRAVEEGAIPVQRYESYLELMESL